MTPPALHTLWVAGRLEQPRHAFVVAVGHPMTLYTAPGAPAMVAPPFSSFRWPQPCKLSAFGSLGAVPGQHETSLGCARNIKVRQLGSSPIGDLSDAAMDRAEIERLSRDPPGSRGRSSGCAASRHPSPVAL